MQKRLALEGLHLFSKAKLTGRGRKNRNRVASQKGRWEKGFHMVRGGW